MSQGYREPSRSEQNSLREAEIAHFQRLQLSANFLEQVLKLGRAHIDAQNAAIAAGVDPGVARFGTRAMQKAIEAEEAAAAANTESSAPEPAAKAPAKPRALHTYIPRVSAPPMLVLAVRAAEMLQDLSPLLTDQWKLLLEHFKVDPRRLALNGDEERMAALMLDELGIQFHEIGATEYARLRDALDKIEAWIKQAKNPDEDSEEGGEAQAGPPGVTQAPPEVQAAQEAAAAESAPPAESKEEHPASRPPAPYSAGGADLDWTKW